MASSSTDSREMLILKGSNSVPAPSHHHYHPIADALPPQASASLEIRLFFVRISPCVADSVPDRLSLSHIRRQIGLSLDVNGSRVPASDTVVLTLNRDRLDRERASGVTYVSTDNVRVTGGVEFEVHEGEDLVLCGSMERIESACCWGSSGGGLESDAKTGWSMDYYVAASIAGGSSAFFRPKIGASSLSVEVYIAGCCSGSPVILTKTVQVQVSPRRKPPKHGVLDAIPEDEEIWKEKKIANGLIHQPKVQITKAENNELDKKIEHDFYPECIYLNDDGQLSWFNAGVRVGVGISLGMCLGIGIGVGVLMRSYQTARRNFRWK